MFFISRTPDDDRRDRVARDAEDQRRDPRPGQRRRVGVAGVAEPLQAPRRPSVAVGRLGCQRAGDGQRHPARDVGPGPGEHADRPRRSTPIAAPPAAGDISRTARPGSRRASARQRPAERRRRDARPRAATPRRASTRFLSTSETPNRPIIAGMKPIPWYSSGLPKVNRAWAWTALRPTVESSRPSSTAEQPLASGSSRDDHGAAQPEHVEPEVLRRAEQRRRLRELAARAGSARPPRTARPRRSTPGPSPGPDPALPRTREAVGRCLGIRRRGRRARDPQQDRRDVPGEDGAGDHRHDRRQGRHGCSQ